MANSATSGCPWHSVRWRSLPPRHSTEIPAPSVSQAERKRRTRRGKRRGHSVPSPSTGMLRLEKQLASLSPAERAKFAGLFHELMGVTLNPRHPARSSEKPGLAPGFSFCIVLVAVSSVGSDYSGPRRWLRGLFVIRLAEFLIEAPRPKQNLDQPTPHLF
jgi:hypothetical protein